MLGCIGCGSEKVDGYDYIDKEKNITAALLYVCDGCAKKIDIKILKQDKQLNEMKLG